MGGTTAKACLIEDGRAEVAPMTGGRARPPLPQGIGLPIKAPVVDMIEIGAGGGSIAAVDEVGLLKVGPRSAGADPGPACYGRGGSSRPSPTPTSLLGYYDPGFFLGGRMTLDQHAAEAALTPLAATARALGDRGRLGHPRVVTEAWPPPPASTSSRRAAIRAATPWSASAAPAPRTPPTWPACSASPR